ncbi:hypothetical protein NQ317_011745 [Molorchus minor]|uniref:Proboscipedia n=1 Tax=Molorchus minor TaxID=1323400 RepID=A0ABQ9IQN6_9CUCU|nr:hypothetical protein NQ317_011745 [Molorchus minor]
MKHKRQTLGKQGEDGDDKDSVTSDGGKSIKLSDKFLDDEMSKKSCQGCEMPSSGLCGSHEEIPDITSTRGNNNNTPSATNNNNNTNFNSNSNGASSVGSSNSFDKLMNEEDSRSNEDSGSHASPRMPKKTSSTTSTAIVKVESRRNSPNSCERKIGMSKMSPSSSHIKESNISLSQHESIPMKMSPKSSTIPGTPAMHPSPLGMSSSMIYSHLQRSSPTTATAIASATVTIQNVPNAVPPFAARGSSSAHFPNQYHMNNQAEYRPDGRAKHYQVPHVYAGDMYNPDHPTINDGQPYHRAQSHPSALPHTTARDMNSRVTGRARQNYHANYHNQHQYYYSKSQAGAESYGIGNQNSYSQGYHSEHPGYNHYGYSANSVYPTDGADSIGPHNMPNSVPTNHDPASNFYPSETIHPMSKVQNQTEYQSKVGYYENNAYGSSQHPPNSDPTYPMPTEMFPGANNNIAGVMTPPTNVQTENSDSYGNFHQFYHGEATQPQIAPPEGSNSSSDFNFLSNLANDYTPEYYQI